MSQVIAPTSARNDLLCQIFGKQLLVQQSDNNLEMKALSRLVVNVKPIERVVTLSGISSQERSALREAPHSRRTTRLFSSTKMIQDPFKPAKRVAGQRKDVW